MSRGWMRGGRLPPRRPGQVWLLLVGLALAACAGRTVSQPTSSAPPGVVAPLGSAAPYPTLNPREVATGRQLYGQYCASCHGASGKGAANWATPGPDGLYPPPPHNDAGHTWHHADRVLYQTIRDGMADPLRPGSPLSMPAFGNRLSDAEIRALIAYLKSLWSPEHRQWQWEQTLGDFAPTPTPLP